MRYTRIVGPICPLCRSDDSINLGKNETGSAYVWACNTCAHEWEVRP